MNPTRPIIDQSIPRKSYSLKKFEILDKPGNFTGYASIFNIQDTQNDIIIPGAFKNTLKRWRKKNKLPPLLWQHDLRQPIGIWKSMIEDEQGLFVEGTLILDIQQAREAYSLMKSGIVEGLSIGFYPILTTPQNHSIRKIFQLELVEVSVVTLAANPLACLQQIKRKMIS